MAEQTAQQTKRKDQRQSEKGQTIEIPRRIVTHNGVVLEEGRYTMDEATIARNGLQAHQYRVVE